MPFYRIKNIPGLTGLIVRTSPAKTNEWWHHVEEIINTNAIVGDHQVSFPVPPDALKIFEEYLVKADDPTGRQYDTTNPFGEFEYDGSFRQGDVEVIFQKYKLGVSIMVNEYQNNDKVKKNVYSQNFFGEWATRALDRVVESLGDLEECVFLLQDLKAEEVTARDKEGK